MTRYQVDFAQKKIVLAIRTACLAMLISPCALAEEDPAVTELTQPAQEISVGVTGVSKDSYKFGEYNGLQDQGAHLNPGFKAGGQGDENSALRWRAEGTDLGLDTRRLEFNGGEQGLFGLHFLYDELPHMLSDSYRTIFNGSGSSSLTLPAGYPTAASRTSTVPASWNNIQSPYATAPNIGTGPGYLLPSLMHDEAISTQRKKAEAGGSVIVSPGWEIKINASHETKDGSKLTGYAFNSASTAAMLAEPIHFTTEGFDASVAYTGEDAHLKLAYLYSQFKNDVSAWTAQTPFAGATGTTGVYNNQALLSSAPENKMHQFGFSGGYHFTPLTQLSFDTSYSRMSQNSAFNCQVANGTSGCISGVNGWSMPGQSADALVVNQSAFIKLTTRPVNNLNLLASYKYDNRDNQTPVRTYNVNFTDAMGAATSSITNDPLNIKRQLAVLSADYGFSRAQAIKLSLQEEIINRSSTGSGLAPSRTAATANSADFTVPAGKTKEDTINLEYRNSMLEDLTGRLSYARSERRASDIASPTPASTTNIATGMSNLFYQQFQNFYVADRSRDKIRAALEYQVSNSVGVDFSVDYNKDHYPDAALQDANSTVFNFDITYAADENFSLNAFYTLEDRHSTLGGSYIATATVAGATLNNVALKNPLGGACSATQSCILKASSWSVEQSDKVNTFGFGGKYTGLMHGKLDINGDIALIFANTPINASGGGVFVSDGAAVPNYSWIPAGSMQDITSKTIQFRLTGNYKIDKSQSMRLSYLFAHLDSSDWQYDAYTNPVAMQAFIGTGMTSPNYNVHVVGLSYIYSFK